MIGELYAPPAGLLEVLDRSRRVLRETGTGDTPSSIAAKRRHDQDLRFQSEWRRHYGPMFE